MRAPRKTLAIIAAAALGGCQGSGGGLVSDGNDEEAAAAILTTTAAGTLGTTGVLLTTAADGKPATYVQRRREITVALARGRGAWIEDLGGELGLPEGLLPHLGSVLKRYREPLSRRLESEDVEVVEWERALAFALCCDPWIRPFARDRYGCREHPDMACVP